MSQTQGKDPIPGVLAPGPLVTVDFKEPRSKLILERVSQRIAKWGDSGRALTRARDALQTADRLIGAGPGAMGAEFRPNGRHVLRLNEIARDEPLWIIGDVRGDVLALETALEFIHETSEQNRPSQILFLGDLTAGVAGDAACLAIALERFALAPTRAILLAGDRELALNSNGDDPAQNHKPRGLAEMPVQPAHQRSLRDLVDSYATWVAKLPVAAVCPGGILLAHSSPPAESMLASLEESESLEACPEALRSFAFNRLHARETRILVPKGLSAETSEDFAQSMRELGRVVGMPVDRLVRGHDSAPEGHRWFRNYGEGVLLTLTTMADVLSKDAGGGRRKPCVGRLKSGRLRVVRLEIPEEIAVASDQIFPRAVTHAPRDHSTTVRDSNANIAQTTSPVKHALKARPVGHAPDTNAARVQFERGVRLLASGDWAGARQAFQSASTAVSDPSACMLNESVACLRMGQFGHQDALGLCRGLLMKNSKNTSAYFNMGVSYLTSERNPIEAGRAFRSAVQLSPSFGDGWWALGLSLAMRADRHNAEAAFAKSVECGTKLALPNSLVGVIPTSQRNALFELLRARAQYHPTAASPAQPLCQG